MEMITVAEAAKLKGRGYSKSSLLQAIRRGTLPATRYGAQFLLDKADVEAFVLPGQGKGERPRARKSFQKDEISVDQLCASEYI